MRTGTWSPGGNASQRLPRLAGLLLPGRHNCLQMATTINLAAEQTGVYATNGVTDALELQLDDPWR